jgi:hypothetical protein
MYPILIPSCIIIVLGIEMVLKLFIADKVLVIIHEKGVPSSNLLINHYINVFSGRFLHTNYVIIN